MESIEYSTVNQQIEKLKSQNLIIDDDLLARNALHLYGYSNLIKSYREPYMINDGNRKIYRSGVSFSQIYSLYLLDKNLRNGVMAVMLDLEEHIKEAAADTIAESFGVHQDQYLVYRNYRNKRKRKYQFTLSGIMNSMNNALRSGKDPIHHYKTEHDIVPPWILFKSIYFSTIINFIDQFKEPEMSRLVERLYDVNNARVLNNSFDKLLMDTLFICMEYRNLAAHGGRIYNYVCNSAFRKTDIFGIEAPDISGFNQQLILLKMLKYKSPGNTLNDLLSEEVNRHCQNFPQDITYLAQVLNVNIVPERIVYVSKSGKLFHTDRHCSGLQSSTGFPLEEAISRGFIPCKKCANGIDPIT